ncbi:MAG: cation:dicarboxylate symporter family transporter [Myxococcota bacterium]
MKLTLSAQVLLGLILGISVGLFFGDGIGPIQVVGDAFVRLLQMTVVPYIAVSLIRAVGGLQVETARLLALRAGTVLIVTWMVALTFVAVFPLFLPATESASFFSSSLVAEREPFDFIGLFIPSNPFFSLAHDIVPAVVLFSIALGVALIRVPNKEGLLQVLTVLEQALTSITGVVARLAPIGVFALTASAAGTMDFGDLQRLQIYLVVYVLCALLLAFWVLPSLVATVTPLTWSDIVRPTRGAVITAFATGNLLVVIPMLAQEVRDLAVARAESPEATATAIEVIVPASFNFPSAGKLLTLSFLPFGAWFVGSSIQLGDYPGFLATGLFSFFGSTATAIPFLLDFLQLPVDLFEIFLALDVIASRFGVMLAAMNTVCLALLGAFATAGGLKVRPVALARFFVTTGGALGGLILIVRLLYGSFDFDAETYQQFIGMDLRLQSAPSAHVRKEPPVPSETYVGRRLSRIQTQKKLRVCYFPQALPFAFVNAKAELVGFDIEMAHRLARELGVAVEFVRVSRGRLPGHLDGGTCDIAMSGLAVSTERASQMALSEPYLQTTMALIVEDFRRGAFMDWALLRRTEGLRIAVPPVSDYVEILHELLPDADLLPVKSARSFFRQDAETEFDAFLHTAEAGSAWTLIYPSFSVVVPEPGRVKVPLAYAMPQNDPSFAQFVNRWIDLQQSNGTVQRLFDHWVRGEATKAKQHRWSVIRDVLHWVD